MHCNANCPRCHLRDACPKLVTHTDKHLCGACGNRW